MENMDNSTWFDWTVTKRLGQGSYGAVYQIERKIPGKKDAEKAALKVMSIPKSNEDIEDLENQGYDRETISTYYRKQLDEIIREYSIMLDLKGHTNIIYCDEVKWTPHEDGIGWDVYIRMELLSPLRDVSGRVYDEKKVVQLGVDICRALSRCQQNGIIHRDVKPQNILVSSSGDYKLGDFGVAKVSEKTTAGTITGTYEYMAPEVFQGLKYNATADIYSLGIVLYWLMNNKRTPFMPQPPQIPSVSQTEAARAKRFSGEEIPDPVHGSAELKKIVKKACAFAPGDRFSSADQMLEELLSIEPAEQSCENVYSQQETLDPERTILPDFQETILTESSQETLLTVEKKEKDKRTRPVLWGIVGVALALGAVFLGTFRGANDHAVAAEPKTTVETILLETTLTGPAIEEATVPSVTIVEAEPEDHRWRENILSSDTIGSDATSVYRSRVSKSQIVSVTFVDSLDAAPMSSWDVSANKDGSVMAWVNGNGSEYDLFIGADGGINGVDSACNLFRHYTRLKAVHFNGNYHLEETESIRGMFRECQSLTSVDTANVNTSSVLDMGQLFQDCESLEHLDLSSWDVSQVQQMDAMFKNCRQLNKINFGEWDSSKALTLKEMFLGCENMTQADLSAFETYAVTDMSSMFEGCKSLVTVDLHSFSTEAAESMGSMFYGCTNLNDVDLRSFDFTNVRKYHYFMDENKTVNGKPWQELF